MKRGLGLLLLAVTLPAGAITGDDLYRDLSSKDAFVRHGANMYLIGVIDGAIGEREAASYAAKKGFKAGPIFFCPPPAITRKQIIEMVETTLREHPESRDADAVDLVLGLLISKWGC